MADVEIRKQTGNRRGLRDALRAVVAAGGTINTDWPVWRIPPIGDQATDTHVLQTMYAQWSEQPVEVDLAALWKQLGIQTNTNTVTFDPGHRWQPSGLKSLNLRHRPYRDRLPERLAGQLENGSNIVVTNA